MVHFANAGDPSFAYYRDCNSGAKTIICNSSAGWLDRLQYVLPAIAIQGQIPIVTDGIPNQKIMVREAFGRLEALSSLSTTNRTWAAIVLRFTEKMVSKTFRLEEMYKFEPELKSLFPNNRHIRPKIRQQLQVLRDAGVIRFLGGGVYERII